MGEWNKLVEDLKKNYSPNEVRRILYAYSAIKIIDEKSKDLFHPNEELPRMKN